MKAAITQTLLDKLPPKNKYYDVWCIKMQGFHVRVSPTGNMTYRCLYQRGKVSTLGKVGVLTPQQAREKAKFLLGQVATGQFLDSNINKNLTFKNYVTDHYTPWRYTSCKHPKKDLDQIKLHFFNLFNEKRLSDISIVDLEKWCLEQLRKNIKPATINRDVVRLKAALSKAVDWGIIRESPLKKWKPLKCDAQAKVCYLTVDEEQRLRQALDDREAEIKAKRDRGNKWRDERGYSLMPDMNKQAFADHLKPMVILSINTGLRRGECLTLQWNNVDFTNNMVTIEGEDAKSGNTRYIPLNQEALKTLKDWKIQCQSDKWVFPNRLGEPYSDIKKSWHGLLKIAKISRFRWHDLRHHFASKLVMRSVDLNTVRELLGHGDLKMTLRYAHLAPEHKANAVAKLLD